MRQFLAGILPRCRPIFTLKYHRENILFSTTPHVRFEAWFGVLMQKYSPKAISEVFILYSVLPNSSDHFTCKDGGAYDFKLNYL